MMQFLTNHPLFRGLSSAALADIARTIEPRHYQADDMIVWQGEPSTAVYLITHGIAVVTRFSVGQQFPTTLAYLMPGESFGEVGLLDNRPRAANVVALTPLDVLVIQRPAFLEILHHYSSVAIELARLLGHYLSEADRRQVRESTPARLILLFDLGVTGGIDSLGYALAEQIARTSEQPTAYVPATDEEPDSHEIDMHMAARMHSHAAGYDILRPLAQHVRPAAVQATLLLDQITNQYRHGVVVLRDMVDASSMVLLTQAQHLILAVPPTESGRQRLRAVRAELARYTASGRIGLSVIVDQDMASATPALDEADYALPLSKLALPDHTALPEAVEQAITTIIDRIDRAHQIAIYLPTTIAVNQMTDTSAYVERTLAFLGERFGGATSTQAKGVWQSEQAGLVGEMVYVVQTYAAEAALHHCLSEVVSYVKELKRELQQEAMALEVDQHLMLI